MFETFRHSLFIPVSFENLTEHFGFSLNLPEFINKGSNNIFYIYSALDKNWRRVRDVF